MGGVGYGPDSPKSARCAVWVVPNPKDGFRCRVCSAVTQTTQRRAVARVRRPECGAVTYREPMRPIYTYIRKMHAVLIFTAQISSCEYKSRTEPCAR
eukprot:2933554-Prymnesium_polylepis.1